MMSSAELLIIFLVALLVFGPKKLPMLAEHLAKLLRFISHIKQQILQFWETKINELTLLENENKAKKADAAYQKENKVD